MAYTAFTWATSSALSAEHLNHCETQYAEALSYCSTRFAPTTGGCAFDGNWYVDTPALSIASNKIANTEYVTHYTKVITASVSNTIRAQDDAEESAWPGGASTLAAIKTFTIPNSHTTGDYRITWDYHAEPLADINSRIYVDGVAAGSLNSMSGTAWVTVTTSISITKAGGTSTYGSTGKEIQLYVYSAVASSTVYARNFRIMCDHSLIAGY